MSQKQEVDKFIFNINTDLGKKLDKLTCEICKKQSEIDTLTEYKKLLNIKQNSEKLIDEMTPKINNLPNTLTFGRIDMYNVDRYRINIINPLITVKKLKQLCKINNIKGYSKLKKKELIHELMKLD